MYGQLIRDKKAVFFDLDGTIVDTEPLWAQGFETVLHEVAPSFSQDIKNIYAETGVSDHIKWENLKKAKHIKTDLSVEELVDKTNKAFLELIENVEFFPALGFWELAYFLKVKKEFPLALTTNSPQNVAQVILDKLDIKETFNFYIFGDQVKNKKPNPEMYLTAAKKLNVEPKDVLVFEDSHCGSQASVAAGMDTVIIGEGFYDRKSYPKEIKKYFPDFRELPTNLDMTYQEAWEDYKQVVIKKYEKKGQVSP